MAKGKIFKKLFAKQPGGSIVGNLLRGFGDKLTGGAISKIIPAPSAASTVPFNTGVANLTTQPDSKMTLVQKLKSNLAYVIGGVVAIGAAVWYFTKPKKRRYGR